MANFCIWISFISWEDNVIWGYGRVICPKPTRPDVKGNPL